MIPKMPRLPSAPRVNGTPPGPQRAVRPPLTIKPLYQVGDIVIEHLGKGRDATELHVRVEKMVAMSCGRFQYVTSSGNSYDDCGLSRSPVYQSIRSRQWPRKENA